MEKQWCEICQKWVLPCTGNNYHVNDRCPNCGGKVNITKKKAR